MRAHPLCVTSILAALSCLSIALPYSEAVAVKRLAVPVQPSIDLSGDWEQESRIVEGKKMDDPPGMRLHVAKKLMTATVREAWWKPAQPISQENYRIDVNQTPMHIDTTGRTAWREIDYRGIFRLENDTLTICLSRDKRPRPTVFETGTWVGMGDVLFVYKRLSGWR